MKILQKLTIKKEFKNLINKRNEIYEKADKCFQPIYGVYYYYFLKSNQKEPLEYNYEELKSAISCLSTNISELKLVENQIKTIYSNNLKYLHKYEDKYLNHDNCLAKLKIQISSLINYIEELQGHQFNKYLMLILNSFHEIYREICEKTTKNQNESYLIS